MKEETMALFDLPHQWIFPVIFVVMTAIIGICFFKYVILAGSDEDEDEESSGEQSQAKREGRETIETAQSESPDSKEK